jgi:hypothetical protein
MKLDQGNKVELKWVSFQKYRANQYDDYICLPFDRKPHNRLPEYVKTGMIAAAKIVENKGVNQPAFSMVAKNSEFKTNALPEISRNRRIARTGLPGHLKVQI